MNDRLEQSLNVLAGSVALTADAFPRATGRTQGWFRRPNQQELNQERILRLVERRRERARIARELHDTFVSGLSRCHPSAAQRSGANACGFAK